MRDPRTDEIAREAARLLEQGSTLSIQGAIGAAAEQLGARDAPRPGPGRVRMHIRAMSMQVLGETGYQAMIDDVRRIAAEIMSTLEHGLPDATTVLVGRAARGEIDHGGPMHIRLYTDETITAVADLLVCRGCDEPQFETADTRHGRLDRLRFIDQGHEVVITRCLPVLRRHMDHDLFTGRAITVIRLSDIESDGEGVS